MVYLVMNVRVEDDKMSAFVSAVEEFAQHHDESLWQCLSQILQVDLTNAQRQFEKSPHFLSLFGRSWFAQCRAHEGARLLLIASQ